MLIAGVLSACGGSSSGGGNPGGGDGNDSFAAAQPVAIGASTAGVISALTDNDWYKFTTTGPGEVTVALTGLSADADLSLYDSVETWLTGSAAPGVANETVTYLAAGAETFHVLVSPAAPTANYTITVTFVSSGGGDGNDTFAAAQTVAVGSSTSGISSSPSDDDWYKFTTTGAGKVTVVLSGLSADANLALYDSTQVLLASSSLTGTTSDLVTYTAAGAGTFYALVIPLATAASYTVTVIFEPTGFTDGNDTFATAETIAVNTTTVGLISSLSDPDWYRIPTAGAGTLTVTLSGLIGDADLELYGSLAHLFVDGSYFAGTRIDTVTYTAAVAADYHVLVIPLGAVTPYSLEVTFTP